MAAHPRIIIIFIISLLLVGCANPVVTNDAVALPALSDAGTATPDTGAPAIPPDSTANTEPTQAAIIEPVLPPPR